MSGKWGEKEIDICFRRMQKTEKKLKWETWTFNELINYCQETGGKNVLNSLKRTMEDFPVHDKKLAKWIQKLPNKNWY